MRDRSAGPFFERSSGMMCGSPLPMQPAAWPFGSEELRAAALGAVKFEGGQTEGREGGKPSPHDLPERSGLSTDHRDLFIRFSPGFVRFVSHDHDLRIRGSRLHDAAGT